MIKRSNFKRSKFTFFMRSIQNCKIDREIETRILRNCSGDRKGPRGIGKVRSGVNLG
jgi:hypothetical protein